MQTQDVEELTAKPKTCKCCGENAIGVWICLDCYDKLKDWLLKKRGIDLSNAQGVDSDWFKNRENYLQDYLKSQKEVVAFT